MKSRSWDYWLLWCVAMLSLAGNAWLARFLLEARRQAGLGAARAAQIAGELEGASLDYTIQVEHFVPLSLTVPFSTTLTVPVSVTVPVDTQVTVPLNTPLGTVPVNLPIQATLPIHIQTQVPVRVMVPVSATLPVVLDLPVHIEIAETAMGQALADSQAYLEALAEDLQTGPLLPR